MNIKEWIEERKYNKWEKEHLEELLPKWEIEQLNKFEAIRKNMPFGKRLLMDVEAFFRSILSRFRLSRWGKYRARK